MLRSVLFVSIVYFSTSCLTLNILGLFPHHGKSHFDVFEPLLKELAARGHNMTILSHFPQKKPLLRYTDINLQGKALVDDVDLRELPTSRFMYYATPLLLAQLAEESCKALRTKQMKEFVQSEQKFDLIIVETFNVDCFLGFVHKYKVPFIGLSSCTLMLWSNTRFGNPTNPSYIPVSFLPFSHQMSFLERVENTLHYIYSQAVFRYLIDPPSYVEAKKFFGDDLPPLADIAKNISLLLVNAHFTLNLPRPLVNNIIEIGGMFLGKPKPLPEQLEKFINDSPNGVIYFSMGSLIKPHSFPTEKRVALVNAFAKLKQRVLWRWDNDTLPNKPGNVMIQAWMPQYDILCHPNVIAFISHGGMLSATEAVQCGVPMVVLPQLGDQFTNAKAIDTIGAGVYLHFADVTEDTITQALNTVLHPSFKRQVKAVSSRFRDRPMSPMDTAVYWIEYVGRHGEARHMRSEAVNLPLHQLLLLDVIAFLLTLFVLFIISLYFTVRLLWKLMFYNQNKLKVQ